MPEISRFFGIVVTMDSNDPAPTHVPVRHGGQEAIVGIDPIRLLEGVLSPRAWSLVREWAELHRAELAQDWELACSNAPLKAIAPLE